MSKSAVVAELCQVETNDELHEFFRGRRNKGNDFARFWLINELLKLTAVGVKGECQQRFAVALSAH